MMRGFGPRGFRGHGDDGHGPEGHDHSADKPGQPEA
jgi:hypothetical protein